MRVSTSRVVLLTDSTAGSVPAEVSRVPLHVHAGDREFLDDSTFAQDDADAYVRSGRPLRTSQPTQAQFSEAYAQAFRHGASDVVVVVLSARLSGTHHQAVLAGRAWPGRVHVVDSYAAGQALGYLATDAWTLANQGASAVTIAQWLVDARARVGAEFCVESLERLLAGGRLTLPMGSVGQRLGIRPMLSLAGGVIRPHGAVRSQQAGKARLVAAARRARDNGATRFTVHHCVSPTDAEHLADMVETEVGIVPMVSPLSTVLAAHTGAGTLAVAWAGPEPRSN
ncbi:DegV family protein [Jonesia denitrificans]|nr:DegV family protein [Jonesia denitrificans]